MSRLHPLSAATIAIHRGVVGFSVPLFLVSFLSGVVDVVTIAWTAVLSPLGLLVGVAWGVVYYYRFEYDLTSDTFDLSSGVVSRRTREIPYRRIQNVDVRQGVLQQLLGVAVVQIETAGGGNTEATLSVVSDDEAERLRREIRRLTAAGGTSRRNDAEGESGRRRETDAVGSGDATDAADSGDATDPATTSPGDRTRPPDGDPTDPDPSESVAERSAPGPGSPSADPERESAAGPEPESSGSPHVDAPTLLFDLSARELLLYSFTSFRVAAAAGVVFLLFFLTEGVLEFLLAAARPFGGPATVGSASLTEYGVLGIVSLVHGVAVTYFLGVVYTFTSYYDFKLGRAGDDLVYERGLLQRYSGSIPLEKVQSVTITTNPLQRAIGYAGLWVETAGYGPDSSGGSQSAVPLARMDRIYWFTERLTAVEEPSFRRPPALARRRYLVRYSLVAGALVVACAGLSIATSIERWWLALAVFAAVPPAAHLRWTNLGYYVGEDHLVIRAGFWRRRTSVVPYYRVQTVSTRRSVFQRRLDLASLVVDTASSQTFFRSTPTIHDVDLEVARDVHGTARERLQSALSERSRSDDGGAAAVVP